MNEQIQAIKEFERYLQPLRVIYSWNSLKCFRKQQKSDENQIDIQIYDTSFNLRTYLVRQRQILHGHECKKFRYLPKVTLIFFNKI